MPPKSRRKIEDLDDGRFHGSDALAVSLIRKWAWGGLSAADVQEFSLAAKQSGADSAEIRKLASIGSFGVNKQNCHRDLIRYVCPSTACVPEPTAIQVPYFDNKGSSDVALLCEMQCILPLDWIDTMASSPETKDLFQLDFCPREDLQRFWMSQDLERNPKFKNHPILEKEDASKGIPVTFHSDGAQFQDRGSLTILSIAPLLSKAAPVDKNLLVAVCPKDCCVPGPQGTWASIWQWVVWSMTWLFRGVHPNADPFGKVFEKDTYRGKKAGKPILPQGMFIFLWAFPADMEFLMNDLGLPRHAAEYPCGWCQGNKSDVPYNDFRLAALWKNTVPKSPPTDHVIMQIPGMTVWHFALDMLHVMELGGTSQMIGNVLFYIVYMLMTDVTRTAACNRIWSEILELYEELEVHHDHRLKELHLKNFYDTKAPWTNFPCCHFMKAAEVKGLIKPVLRLAERYCDMSDDEGKHVVLAMRNLSVFYDALSSAPMTPDESHRKKLNDSMTKFLLHYSYLGKLAFDQRRQMYSFVPKIHYMAHLAQQAMFLNPKYVTCYSGEDYVGQISQLGHTCLYGTVGWKLSVPLFGKYRIAMYLRFTWHIDIYL
jgi:hypothetical protein